FTDTHPARLYLLPLHAALPISLARARPAPARRRPPARRPGAARAHCRRAVGRSGGHFANDVAAGFLVELELEQPAGLGLLEQLRSEEHTSELQSRENLVCRLLL